MAAGLAIFWAFAGISGHGWNPLLYSAKAQDWGDLYDVTRSAMAAAALIGATVAGAIAVRRQHSTERSVRISARAQLVAAESQWLAVQTYERELAQQHADGISRLRDRYTIAAAQLGDDSPAVRLAGAYAMAALADEWLGHEREDGSHSEAQVCMDLLCGYIRTPPKSSDHIQARADREVRESIVRIIAGHLEEAARVSWQGFNFDFTRAEFDGAFDFRGARFAGGRVSFLGARFSGGHVSFISARFSGGEVLFNGAQFSGASIYLGDATFEGASVDFTGAKFKGGEASFIDTRYTEGQVLFMAAEFAGSVIQFDRADFSGGLVSFNYAKFLKGNVDFSAATFSGAEVYFGTAEFCGGSASFTEGELQKGVLDGPWGGGLPPEGIWPADAEGSSRKAGHSRRT